MTTTEKVTIGCLGGLAAVCVKFLGEYDFIINNFELLAPRQQNGMIVGYAALTPILVFLGGLIAGLSDETNRLKLLALGVAAPAVITTYSGGPKGVQVAALDSATPVSFQVAAAPSSLSFIRAAHAGDPKISCAPPAAGEAKPQNPLCSDTLTPARQAEQSSIDLVKEGIKSFFGYEKTVQRYWVIVGSFRDRDGAERYASRINTERPELKAFVGLRLPDNPYYPVIVGELLPYAQASQLKAKALDAKTISDAYLSANADRLPRPVTKVD